MIYQANSEERGRLIAGLRELADFLAQNPDVGAMANDADSPAGHYSAGRDFGPVHYRAVAIPNRDDANNEG